MLRVFACFVSCTAVATCLAHDLSGMPHPDWQPKPSDPAWMRQVVQLHGHLGPWVVAGFRLGTAGAKAVDAKGHFDARVTCEGPFAKPPQSCFLDGIQFGSGATLGKRTIEVVEAKQIVVRIQNPRTKKTVEVRPTQTLLDILNTPETENKQLSQEQVEQIARDIAAMPDDALLTFTQP